MTAWLAFRILKFVGLSLLAVGLGRAVAADTQEVRIRAASRDAIAGLVLTWAAGYGLMKLGARSLGEPWILQSMAASLVAVAAALWAGMRPGQTTPAAFVVGGGLVAAIATMVTRGEAPLWSVGVLPVLAGGAGALLVRGSNSPEPAPDVRGQFLTWFRWIARLEGVSLILLVVISMPLRRAAGISLDGGTGLLGWVHGVLVVVFVPGIALAGWAGNWPSSRSAIAFVASLIPGGTFWFEHRYLR